MMSYLRLTLLTAWITLSFRDAVVAQDCNYQAQLNNHTIGGTAWQSATTVAACQQACTDNTWCVACDWDPLNNQGIFCWLARADSAVGPAQGVTRFVRTCTTNPTYIWTLPTTTGCTWVASNNNHTLNGQLQPSALTIQDCQNLCLRNSSCSVNGFDWNPSSPSGQQCYLSTSNVLYSLTGVVHYLPYCSAAAPTSIPSDYTVCWDSSTNKTFINRVLQPYPDLYSCINSCLQTIRQSCYGVDWYAPYPSGKQCYFAVNVTDISSDSQPQPRPLHYFFNEQKCKGCTLQCSGLFVLFAILVNCFIQKIGLSLENIYV